MVKGEAVASREELEAWVLAAVPRAVAYARSLVRDAHTAEDLVQDCLARLLAKRYDLLQDGQRLLYKAITNACINWSSRKKTMASLDAEGMDLAGRDAFAADEIAGGRELEAAIAEGLVKLPPLQRAAVELRALGHSQEDVAAILEVSGTNAGVLIYRGRKALAAHLEPFLGEEAVR